MTEISYQKKRENAAIEELKVLLAKPDPIEDGDGLGDFFDPWDFFGMYGTYSSGFDAMAIPALEAILSRQFGRSDDLAREMFYEILCFKNLCDYGTSPRYPFATPQFKELLPELIRKWKHYSKMQWSTSDE